MRKHLHLLDALFAGEIPQDTTVAYPRKSPIEIRTSEGITYILPIDSNEPYIPDVSGYYNLYLDSYPVWDIRRAIECEAIGCLTFSPNNLYPIGRIDDETLSVGFNRELAGHDFLFSSTSDSLAVWHQNFIQIYAVPNRRLHDWELVYHPVLNSVEINGENFGVDGAVWSPDGRRLAYSDSQGLWFWDALTPDAEPDLLLETENDVIPMARYFSPMGRYLAITNGVTRYTLDIVSGHEYGDGLISPDDRQIVLFDTSAELFQIEQVCSLISSNCSVFDSALFYWISDVERYNLPNLRYLEWTDNYHFYAVACHDEIETLCGIARNNVFFAHFDLISMGTAFDYDPIDQSLLILQDEQTIWN